MNVFENVSVNAKALLSEWIQVSDPKNKLTIEDFQDEGVDESKTNGHCWRCVTVNQCWFKNEEDKKPKEFDYSKYSLSDIPLLKRGLYHPNCHDKKFSINVPKLNQIQLKELRKNFNDFFRRKKKIFYGIGYSSQDENELMNFVENVVKNKYSFGDYYFYKHWKHGFQINISITIQGKNQFKNEYKTFKSGYIIYPNGQLKIATIFAGRI